MRTSPQKTIRWNDRDETRGLRRSHSTELRIRRQYFANTIWTLIADASAQLMPVECTTSGRPSRLASQARTRVLATNHQMYRNRWGPGNLGRSEEHTSELQSRGHLVCRLLLEKKKN